MTVKQKSKRKPHYHLWRRIPRRIVRAVEDKVVEKTQACLHVRPQRDLARLSEQALEMRPKRDQNVLTHLVGLYAQSVEAGFRQPVDVPPLRRLERGPAALRVVGRRIRTLL